MRIGIRGVVHQNLIRMMAGYFQRQGYTDIRADVTGYSQPAKISDCTPDLTCRKGDHRRTPIILEAETCDTLSDAHTHDQWMAFYHYARSIGGEFYIVVPTLCNNISGRDLVRQRLIHLGISADAIWVPRDRLRLLA
ncbi:MAG: hypothetical protein IBX64_13070 [Actinobacteria bacterium]|nr:hypothetical protein [Actinomycetota bacterium]